MKKSKNKLNLSDIFGKGKKYKCIICGGEGIDYYKDRNIYNQRVYCNKCAEELWRKLR